MKTYVDDSGRTVITTEDGQTPHHGERRVKDDSGIITTNDFTMVNGKIARRRREGGDEIKK